MGADVSRVRLDALRDHSGVVLQQGRLLLDADWNELVAIIDRRLRANAVDLGSTGPVPGIAGVGVVPRTTPDGFRIDATGGAISIGIGRMYVDGLLAENHGLPDLTFEPLLEDRAGTKRTPYDKQPYWPTPAALPTAGSHLVYLDAWNREVTPLEAPDLVESAVGVDTTTRTQTTWQVRVLPDSAADVTCSTPDKDIPGWLDVTIPSAGRLTTGIVPVDDEDDPCALPPTGGYRGPENQTYRVEIHSGGAPGTATFTWSRDNGSVASPVVEVVSASRVRPASLGKDSVLRFRTGDWVEIIDDHRELNQQSGELRRIEVHEEDGTISWTAPVPPDLQMTTAQAAERHLRVRRWDHSGTIKTTTNATVVDLDLPGATGAIPVPASGAAIVLEHGVTVRLEAPGGKFRSGDYWIFAARTADTSVESLVAAPPRGIHHHYTRLAVVAFPGSETDCRTLWPPLPTGDTCGECTVCVTPESHASGTLTIQQAIDKVQPTGGTVCLEAGTYRLDDAVRIIDAQSVTVRGQGPRTLLLARFTGVEVRSSTSVTLQDFAVVTVGNAAIQLVTTAAATVQRLTILASGTANGRFSPGTGIELARVALRPSLRDNVIVATVGIASGDAEQGALLTAALEVSGNVLLTERSGVALGSQVAHVLGNTVRDNTVLRAYTAGIVTTGAVGPGGGMEVRGNTVVVEGTGIVVGTAGCDVRDNRVTGPLESWERREDGIAVHPATLSAARGTVTISRNHVRDVGGTGIAVQAPVGDLDVSGNEVRGALAGIVVTDHGRSDSASIVHNVVRDVGSRSSDGGGQQGTVGIQVLGAARANIDGNIVTGVGIGDREGSESTGVRVLATLDSRVAGNEVDRVGFAEAPGVGIGVQVSGFFSRTVVDGNSARRLPLDVDATPPSEWTGLLIGFQPKDGPPVNTVAGFIAFTSEANYLLGRRSVYVIATRDVSAVVDSNIVTGGGYTPAALVAVPGDVIVNGNQLRQLRDSARPALELFAEAASVQGNRARGGNPSMDLTVNPQRVAVVANLVLTQIIVLGAPLGAPWSALNPGGF